jgi:hypothetical protein
MAPLAEAGSRSEVAAADTDGDIECRVTQPICHGLDAIQTPEVRQWPRPAGLSSLAQIANSDRSQVDPPPGRWATSVGAGGGLPESIPPRHSRLSHRGNTLARSRWAFVERIFSGISG